MKIDIFSHRAVAVREFALTGGFANYLLIVDKKAIGNVCYNDVRKDLEWPEPLAGPGSQRTIHSIRYGRQ